MPRASSITVLPPEIQEKIGQLFMKGRTIDDILAHLETIEDVPTISRSALGRHVKGLSETVEKVRRARAITLAMRQELGDTPESDAARLNIEMTHTAIFDLMTALEEGQSVAPKQILELAQSLSHLAKASKTNLDFTAQVEKRAAEMAANMRGQVLTEAADKAATVATEAGLSAVRAAQIRRDVLGLRSHA
jgi:hypothetical protein